MTRFFLKLHNIFQFLRLKIFTSAQVNVYKMSEHVEQNSRAEIRKVTPENVEDARSFQSDHLIEIFRGFLSNGDKGYYGYIDNKCVHRSWVKTAGQVVQPHWAYKYELLEDEAYIHYCETAPCARGLGIYPHVLSFITHDLFDQQISIAIDEKNTASIHGATKVGFTKKLEVNALIILGANLTSTKRVFDKIE